MKIAIQGEQGCFHQIAANKYFNNKVEILSCNNFPTLVNEVLRGDNCDLGIMAIENSIAGSIIQNYKLLQKTNLKIVGETYLAIQQNLIAFKETPLSNIKEVISHPMAIYQCQEFLNTLPNIKVIETEDTAGSARDIKQNNWKDKAAIAGDLAAEIYGMEIIKSSIETNKANYTRFLIISNSNNQELESTNKASLYFSVLHKTGSLAKILTLIANYNINLSKLQSYPIIGEKWQYYFYIDIEYENYKKYQLLIEDLKKITNKLIVLGNYKNGLK